MQVFLNSHCQCSFYVINAFNQEESLQHSSMLLWLSFVVEWHVTVTEMNYSS